MKILVVNAGSSSLKFSIHDMEWHSQGYDTCEGSVLLRGRVTGIGGSTRCVLTHGDRICRTSDHQIPNIEAAVGWMCEVLQEDQPLRGSWDDIEAVGHRVVHGGEMFTRSISIDDTVLHQIEQLHDLAPLHNPSCVKAIRRLQGTLRQAIPMVTVFDTAFHATLPEHVRTYALPSALTHKTNIRRYGFHGIAHASLAIGYAKAIKRPLQRDRLVTLQLGNGCSMAAIDRGKSVETSMGFTPLEGLVMGTRTGDIDPAVVCYLMTHHAMNVADVEQLLNEQSGLLGISERSSDMQVLLRAAYEEQDARAQLAIDMFCHRIRKYLGAYLAVLHGAEAIIFGGGIGENAPEIRARVCHGMEWCGLQLDSQRNEEAIGLTSGSATKVSQDRSRIAVHVVATDEETLIAQETIRCLEHTKNSI